MIWQLAWRNIWRHKIRSALTIFAITFATALLSFMLSFQLGSYETMKQQNLKILSGYAQIQQVDFAEQPSLKKSFQIPPALQTTLGNLPKNTHYGFRIQSFVITSNLEDTAHHATMLLGVEPNKETKLSTIPNRIIHGRYLQNPTAREGVIGQTLADQLQVNVGDQIQILGQDFNDSLAIELITVVGIFDIHLDTLNQQLIQIPLQTFQSIFAVEHKIQQVIFITPQIQQAAQIEFFVDPLLNQNFGNPQNLVWKNWQDLQPQLAQAIQLDLTSALLFYAILLTIVILILSNTLYMSILERHNEFALLHALGLQNSQLSNMVNIELLISILLGVFAGVLLGTTVTVYFIFYGITFSGMEEVFAEYGLSGTLYPIINAYTLGFVPLVMLFATLILGAFIRWRLNQIQPLTGRQL